MVIFQETKKKKNFAKMVVFRLFNRVVNQCPRLNRVLSSNV